MRKNPEINLFIQVVKYIDIVVNLQRYVYGLIQSTYDDNVEFVRYIDFGYDEEFVEENDIRNNIREVLLTDPPVVNEIFNEDEIEILLESNVRFLPVYITGGQGIDLANFYILDFLNRNSEYGMRRGDYRWELDYELERKEEYYLESRSLLTGEESEWLYDPDYRPNRKRKRELIQLDFNDREKLAIKIADETVTKELTKLPYISKLIILSVKLSLLIVKNKNYVKDLVNLVANIREISHFIYKDRNYYSNLIDGLPDSILVFVDREL